jgi:hypothetical protein
MSEGAALTDRMRILIESEDGTGMSTRVFLVDGDGTKVMDLSMALPIQNLNIHACEPIRMGLIAPQFQMKVKIQFVRLLADNPEVLVYIRDAVQEAYRLIEERT